VALVAHLVDIGNKQQPRILGTMRCVAPDAPFRLHGSMFEYKRAAGLRMALGADHVHIGCRPELIVAERPMRVVAIGAFHQPIVHLVMEGLTECGLHVGVATEAELGLVDLEQVRLGPQAVRTIVNAMAARTADTGSAVVRTLEVRVCSRMAAEARRIDLLGGHLAQPQNLGRISARLDVRLPWSMAALTCDTLAAMHERELGVRVRGKLLRKIRVAQSASL